MRSLEPKDVVKGSEMMLEGQVSGSTPFTVSFYKNTKPIRNDKRHRVTVKDDLVALQVLAVEAGDVGSYQCTVENEVGRATCDCQVTLKGRFRCYQIYLSIIFSVANLEVYISNPLHTYIWIFIQT